MVHKTKPAPKVARAPGIDLTAALLNTAGCGRVAFGGGVSFRVFLQKVERGSFFSRKLGGFWNILDRSGSGHFRQQLNAAVVLETRSGRDEAAHDDVFLQATEIIHLASHRCFREDASSLLEAGRGDERVGRERRLGDAKEQRTSRCRAAA